MRQFQTRFDTSDGHKIRNVSDDLSNKKVGYLKVLSKTNKRLNIWSCVCDCGKHTTATTGQLISRKKTHCGCLKRKAIPDDVKAELEAKYNGRISPAHGKKKRHGFEYGWKHNGKP